MSMLLSVPTTKLMQIDRALNQDDCVAIMSLLCISYFDDLLSNEIDLTFSNLTSPDEGRSHRSGWSSFNRTTFQDKRENIL